MAFVHLCEPTQTLASEFRDQGRILRLSAEADANGPNAIVDDPAAVDIILCPGTPHDTLRFLRVMLRHPLRRINFDALYEGMPRYDRLFPCLLDAGLDLVSFYRMYYRFGRALYTNGLFVNPQFTSSNSRKVKLHTEAATT